jgi:coenzyme F420-reducing hydrogenase beta subunit
MLACALATSTGVVRPITGPWPTAFPAKELCSNCGLCKSSVGVESVTEACAFIGDGMSRAEQLEPMVHGRGRQYDDRDLSEAHFGVHQTIALARGVGMEGAQWTGVTTSVATAWLEAGKVDAVIVAGSDGDSSFGAPKPVLCRSPSEVLLGRRVKPSLCPSLEVLDEVRDDPSIRRLLFCGVGCSVQALRAMNGGDPEGALNLEPGGLWVLGTHCVDNSPTPDAARNFVSAIPGIGEQRADSVLAYEFMADFRVHARLRKVRTRKPKASPRRGKIHAKSMRPRLSASSDLLPRSLLSDSLLSDSLAFSMLYPCAQEGSVTGEEEVVKQAYMTLPPSVGIPSIAPSCFACFDYTNGLADLVVGYMGAPFDADSDEMTSAALMVTVRNARGQAMLDEAVGAGRVQVLQDGGRGGAALPSSGDRAAITMKTVAADSMVKSLLDPDGFVAGNAGAPPLVANFLAKIIAKGLPTGLEFGRFSIDYHYLRNALYVETTQGEARADRHVPRYARAIMAKYDREMRELKEPATKADAEPLAALRRLLGMSDD